MNKINFIFNIVFAAILSSAAAAQDVPLPGAIFIGSGSNSNVYRLPDGTVQKIIVGGTETRDQLFQFTNEMANRNPGVVLPVTKSGQNSLIQNYAQGYTMDELKARGTDVSIKAIFKSEDLVLRNLREMSGEWLGNSGKANPLVMGETLLLPNGSRMKIDEHLANFRFNADGTVRSWYDPIFIADKAYERSLVQQKPLVLTNLPIDQSGSPAPVVQPLPGESRVHGLSNVRAFTFLSSTMAAGDLLLTYNDYRNAYRSARTAQEREQLGADFVNTVLLTLGISIAAVVVVTAISASAPLVAAGLTVAFVGLGAVAFGTHLSATFNTDILDFWEFQTRMANYENNKNHPLYDKMIRMQAANLQQQVAARARQRPGFDGVVTADDLEAIVIRSYPNFENKAYTPKPGTKFDIDGHQNGFTTADMRLNEVILFRQYSEIRESLRWNLTPQQLKVVADKMAATGKVKSVLQKMGQTSQQKVEVHSTMATQALLAYKVRYQEMYGPGTVGGTTPTPASISSSMYPQNSYQIPVGVKVVDMNRIAYTGTVTAGPFVEAGTGAIIDPSITSNQSYYDRDFNRIDPNAGLTSDFGSSSFGSSSFGSSNWGGSFSDGFGGDIDFGFSDFSFGGSGGPGGGGGKPISFFSSQ